MKSKMGTLSTESTTKNWKTFELLTEIILLGCKQNTDVDSLSQKSEGINLAIGC